MKKTNMKRNMITGAFAAAMTAAAFLPVYAADTASMTVNYTQDTTYMLSIPNTINLSDATETKKDNVIALSKVNTAPDKKVQVKIESGITNNKVTLTRTGDPTTTVVSTVMNKDKTPIANGHIVAEFLGTENDPTPLNPAENVLVFSKIEDAGNANATVKAGEYTGTIVFKAAVVDVPQP